jgi:glycine/D-amino acid oxidase-like deaminating enzyme/nitrite reductase/ring-hydroxylating ferredoxin subunit
VCVVGAGICGLTAALLLARAGARVLVLDRDRAGHGVSGHTTAKVTALHGTVYDELRRRHGLRAARGYADAQRAGMDLVAGWVDELGLDCDLRRRPAYTYVEDEDERATIEREVVAGREAGLATTLVAETPLPYPVAAAVRLDDQLELHAGAYLRGLAAAVEDAGGRIAEGTTATGVTSRGVPVVRTSTGAAVTADRVVVATLYPFLDRGLYWTRLTPKRSYAIAVRAGGAVPEGMFITAGEPTRSVRATPGERAGVEGELLVVGGEGHATGEQGETTPDRIRRLAAFARERLGGHEVTHRWSAHDLTTADGMPYVGRYLPTGDRILVGTGFRKWGYSNGTAAGIALADLAQGRGSEIAELFDPWRATVRQSALGIASEGLKTGRHFAADWLRAAVTTGELEALRAGEARILRDGRHAVAAHRDDEGRLHAVSAACTHLGCRVAWNGAERSWDCPCHGSRFAPDGTVLQGPATRPLPAVRPES